MLIRIKQVRKLPDGKSFGTNVDLTKKGGPRNVHEFRPLNPAKPDEDHVCDVSDPDDVAQLLAIKEGYEIHPTVLKPGAAKKVEITTTASAAAASGIQTAGDKTETGDQKTGEVANASKTHTGDTNAPGPLTKDELIAAVAKKTGKKPHPSTSVKKLQEMLAS